MMPESLSKALIVSGLVLIAIGLVLPIAAKLPWLGRLPGDILFRKGNFTFYFPLATSIAVSLLLTLVLSLLGRK